MNDDRDYADALDFLAELRGLVVVGLIEVDEDSDPSTPRFQLTREGRAAIAPEASL